MKRLSMGSRLALVLIMVATALTLLESPALAKKPAKPEPHLTDASLELDCDSGDAVFSYAWADVSGKWIVRLTWLVDRPDGSHEEIDNWRTITEDEQPTGSVEGAGWWPTVPEQLTMRVALAKGDIGQTKQAARREVANPLVRTVVCATR